MITITAQGSTALAGSLLSAAQSFPNLTSGTTSTTTSTLTPASTSQTMSGQVAAWSRALTMSLASSDSDNDFLEMCRARTFLAELEDDDELPEADDECDENENEESNDKMEDDYDDVGVWIEFS